jgi:lysozyme family protein
MAEKLFEDVVNFTLDREGRVVSMDPTDRGGPTAYGISQRAHPDAWNGGPPTLEEAIDIYRVAYWQDNGVCELPPAVAAATFDYRVHSGDTAVTELQKLVGVEPDGQIGPVTQAAIRARGEMLVGHELTNRRRQNLINLTKAVEHFRRWARGWSMRCDKVNSFLYDVTNRALEGVYGEPLHGNFPELHPATSFPETTEKPRRKKASRKKGKDAD